MGEASKAVFISYASQDAEAARRICDALRAAGVEVWFDQSELRGGDTWDHKIRKQIKECALFMPVISATTQARGEGYFRLEWKLAVDRSHLMADDAAFLFPVVIDEISDAVARVPDKFREVQWTRLSVVHTPETLAARVGKLLAGAAPEARHSDAPPASAHRDKTQSWLKVVLPLAGLVFGLIFALRGTWSRPHRSAATPEPVAPSAAPLAEARQLLVRARAMSIDKYNSTADDYATAESLIKRALELDPTDGEIWAASSLLNTNFRTRGFDHAPARREAARREAERALKLAPDSVEALYALGRWQRDNDPAMAEATFKAVLARDPNHAATLGSLGIFYQRTGRFDEAIALLQRLERIPEWKALALYSQFLAHFSRSHFADAERCVRGSIAAEPSANSVGGLAMLLLTRYGDADAAIRVLATAPGVNRNEHRVVWMTTLAQLAARKPDDALQTLSRLSADFIQDNWFVGPKAYWVGRAFAQAGRPDAARNAFEAALTITTAHLKETPSNLGLLVTQGELLAFLGRTDEALQVERTLAQLERQDGLIWIDSGARIFAALGRADDAVPLLAKLVPPRADVDYGWPLTGALLKIDPLWDRICGDARFQALCAEPKVESALAAAVVDEKSVAVLAFTNLSDDKGNEYFSDGISEELLNVLAKIPGLKVSARTSAFYFKGKEVPIPEIAQKLGVAYVVEGSVRTAGNKVRITAQLIKASDGFHVWSNTFTRDLKDIFAVQDEIAGLIAKNLSLKIGVGPTEARRTVNPEAHRLVLEGRHFWNLRTTDGFVRAETAFAKAIEIDPQFPEAHAGLADVLVSRAIYDGYDGSNVATAPSAIVEAERAQALDPNLAEAYPAKASELMAEGRLIEAEQEFKQALKLNPNYALAHHWYALLLEVQGRLDVALTEIDRAVQLDPLSVAALSTRARLLLSADRFAEALAGYEQSLVLRPSFLFVQGERALCLHNLGRTKEALVVARAMAAEPSMDRRWLSDSEIVYLLRQTDHQAEADAFATQQLARLPPGSFLRGLILAALGRQVEALPFLERTPACLRAMYYWNPVWNSWRDDARFQQLMVKLRCAEEYQVAREARSRMLNERKAKQ